MTRQILIYGAIGGILITLLKWSEYRFLVLEHSFAIYGGLTAAIFAIIGIWLGRKLATSRLPGDPRQPTPSAFAPNTQKRDALNITPRELEVLQLVAQGLSNSEIATRLFVSENTVKTHCSRTFDKLGAKRRTQAVQLGKELGLLS